MSALYIRSDGTKIDLTVLKKTMDAESETVLARAPALELAPALAQVFS